MKNKKYVLTDKTMKFEGRILHRIKAIKDFNNVKAGDLGGWVESEYNLGYEGDCWIYDEAKAMDNSRVFANARLYNHSIICDNGIATGNAIMWEDTRIYNDAIIHDNAQMHGHSIMCDDTEIFGNAEMFDDSILYNFATMLDNSKIRDKAIMKDNAKIYNNSEMYDNSVMCANAKMRDNAKMYNNSILKENEVLRGTLTHKADNFIEINNPKGRMVTGMLIDGEIFYSVGCQEQITKKTFMDRIYNRDGGVEANPHRAEYLKIIYMIETYLKGEININHI